MHSVEQVFVHSTQCEPGLRARSTAAAQEAEGNNGSRVVPCGSGTVRATSADPGAADRVCRPLVETTPLPPKSIFLRETTGADLRKPGANLGSALPQTSAK